MGIPDLLFLLLLFFPKNMEMKYEFLLTIKELEEYILKT